MRIQRKLGHWLTSAGAAAGHGTKAGRLFPLVLLSTGLGASVCGCIESNGSGAQAVTTPGPSDTVPAPSSPTDPSATGPSQTSPLPTAQPSQTMPVGPTGTVAPTPEGSQPGPTGSTVGPDPGAGGAPSPSNPMPAAGGAGGTGPMGSGGSVSAGGVGGAGGAGGAGGTDVGGGFTTCPAPTEDWTSKPVTVFNDDGAWTWYSDERAVVDPVNRKIIVGSDANGGNRNGNVDAVIYDVDTGMSSPVHALGDLDPDDHNTAAFLVKPGGGYLAFWAGHNQNCNSYFSNYDNGSWAPSQTFDWAPRGCPWTFNGNQRSVTYNNLWAMTAEGPETIYNFVRSIDTSPNFLISNDNGATWNYGGRLTSTPGAGYVAGYYKYWGNNVDRIDFFATEAHPRDQDNNLFHGYVKGGKSYDSMDNVVDDDITDGNAPDIPEFTTVFSTGSNLGDVTLNHMWNADLMSYDGGTVAAIFTGRNAAQSDIRADHRFGYARFDGASWKNTYLGHTGPNLYYDEEDYTGLGALHPNDPRVIFISTTIDPRDDSTDLGHHEIFMGTTCDEGATFSWVPVTQGSNVDNVRPIVPLWDEHNMVLLWFRGTYDTAQQYDEEVVGIVITDQ